MFPENIWKTRDWNDDFDALSTPSSFHCCLSQDSITYTCLSPLLSSVLLEWCSSVLPPNLVKRELASYTDSLFRFSYLSILVATVETYATLQQTIVHDFRELIPTADAIAVSNHPIPPSPFNLVSSSSSIRGGRFAFYAVRRGRTTGIFDNWSDCFRSTNGVSNQFKGFHSRDEAERYLTSNLQ